MRLPPSRTTDAYVGSPEFVELERKQARRDVDRAITRLFEVHLRTAGTRCQAIEAINSAAQLMHHDVRWFADRQLAQAVEARWLRRHLTAVPGPEEVDPR